MNLQLIYYFLAVYLAFSELSDRAIEFPSASAQHGAPRKDTFSLGNLCPFLAQHYISNVMICGYSETQYVSTLQHVTQRHI